MEKLDNLIRLFRALYLICKNSEKHQIILDKETLKGILDDLKEVGDRS